MLKLWLRAFGQGAALVGVLGAAFFTYKQIVSSRRPRTPAKRVVHIFYDKEIEEAVAPHAARETLSAWKYNWRLAGWHPRILTTFDSQHSSLHDDLVHALSLARYKHANEKETSCLMRYVAMAAVGGGWLSDIDTVPTNLQPGRDLPNNGNFTVFENEFASMMSGTRVEFERVLRVLLRRLRKGKVSTGVPGVCSDKHMLRTMVAEGQILSMRLVIPADFWSDTATCANMTENRSFAIQFSQASIENLGYLVDGRGALMNRTMDRWRACRNKNTLVV